jgi:uncharacterized membrane protein
MNRRWVGAALIGVMAVGTFAVWGRLPAEIPSHWNFRGEVTDWSPRFPGALFPLLVAAGMWLLLPALRRVDPRRAHYEKFDGTFNLLINVMVLYMAVLQGLVLAYALGWEVDVSRAMIAMIGVTFVAIGNFLPRIRSNWWMGIRTPWTLESERVWRETHRLAGWTFVVGGAVAVLAMFLPPDLRFPVAMSGLATGTLIPVVWSYVLWRRHGPEGTEV